MSWVSFHLLEHGDAAVGGRRVGLLCVPPYIIKSYLASEWGERRCASFPWNHPFPCFHPPPCFILDVTSPGKLLTNKVGAANSCHFRDALCWRRRLIGVCKQFSPRHSRVFDKKNAFLPSRTCSKTAYDLLLVELKGNPLQFNLAPQKLDSHVWLASDKDCDPRDGCTPFELL